MNFKLVPVVTFHEKDGDKEAHYTFEMKNVAMEAIEKQVRDEDDPSDYYVTKEGRQDRRTLAEGVLKGGDNLDGVKTIYFDDTCRVPRFKLGELCGKQGIKVIRDRDKADAVIYGSKFTETLFSNRTFDSFNYKADLIVQAKKVKAKRNLITEILPLVEACESDVIFLDGYRDNANGNECKLSVQKTDKKDEAPSFDIDYIEVADESKYLLATQKSNMIHQDVILEQLSSIVMDEPMYRSVCSMFESPDTSNHLVAMEVMSNTAYRKSIVYILNLMRKYYQVAIKNVHAKSNISFKALREYLEYEPNYQERSLDAIVNKIVEKNALSESNYKLILKLIMEEEKESMTSDDNRWVITSVDLHPDIKANIIWDKKEETVIPIDREQPIFTA